eukprot:gb/GECG01012515.1/.p1 GENE.gb/GECG01012515.1/~~gb/GECG01012515.1/.p1  ORF type:complete len:110 (+),score=6.97 gb/GECG01012515.1/:1-330(+)
MIIAARQQCPKSYRDLVERFFGEFQMYPLPPLQITPLNHVSKIPHFTFSRPTSSKMSCEATFWKVSNVSPPSVANYPSKSCFQNSPFHFLSPHCIKDAAFVKRPRKTAA